MSVFFLAEGLGCSRLVSSFCLFLELSLKARGKVQVPLEDLRQDIAAWPGKQLATLKASFR